MKIDPVLLMMLGAAVALIMKIVWDWFQSGRVEKGVYMTAKDCEDNRDKCCVPQLKRDFGVFGNRLSNAEKSLDQGREDFRLLREDIGDIKENMAGIKVVLEALLKEKR